MQRFALRLYFVVIVFCSCFATPAAAQTPAEFENADKFFDQALNDYDAKRYDAAIKNYSEYIKIRPKVGAGWFNRGLAYYHKAQSNPDEATYRLAAADLSEAIKLDPKTPDYWFVRGGIYSQLMAVDFERSRDQAIADFTSAIRLDPRFAAAYRERGVVYERINRNDDAFADLNTSIKFDPSNPLAFYTRAKIHGFRKNYAAARADAQAALKLAPDYEYAKIYLNYINNEELKAAQTKTATPTPKQIDLPTLPKYAASTGSGTSTAVTALTSIKDAGDGYSKTKAAYDAGNHRETVRLATETLKLIPMAGLTTQNDTDYIIYTEVLTMRARAYLAVKDVDASDDDYDKLTQTSMHTTLKHMQAGLRELQEDRSGSGAGLIMASVESSKATIYCQTAVGTALEWVEAVKKTRPNQTGPGLMAGISLMAMREMCVKAHIMHSTHTAASGALTPKDRTKAYQEAVGILDKAIQMMPRYAETYEARAKIYRRMGRADLAAADEKFALDLKQPTNPQ